MAYTLKGSQIFVCTTPKPNDLTQAEFEGLTWVEVKNVGAIGQTGSETNIVNYDEMGTEVVQKQKGIKNAGDPEIECSRNATDPGQIALRAAGLTKSYYPVKIVVDDRPYAFFDGTTFYLRGLITGPIRPGGRNEDFNLETFKVAAVQQEIVVDPVLTFPFPDASLLGHLQYDRDLYYSSTLGTITANQAISTTRPSVSADHALDIDGLMVEFAPNVPRITYGEGLWSEGNGTSRLGFNTDLSHANWLKSANMVIAQDYPSPFKSGSPAGWSLRTNGTGNATIKYTIGAIAATAVENFTTPHGSFFWDGTPLFGPIQITQDDFVIYTDIRPYLIAGRWKHIAGDVRPNDASGRTFGVRIVDARDVIGFSLGNITRGQQVGTPVLSVSATTKTRLDDFNEVRLANFGTLWNKRKLTVISVTTPGMFPFIPVGSIDPNPTRRGWTAASFDNPWNILATGVGEITNDLMNIDSKSYGTFAIDQMVAVGTGVQSRTKIVPPPATGTGSTGTYNTFSEMSGQAGYDPFQSTPANIVIDTRSQTANRLSLNAAHKPDDPERPNAQRIGVTVEIENAVPYVAYGFDPQTEDFRYNVPNCDGYTFDLDAKTGTIALRGDIYNSLPTHLTSTPTFISTAKMTQGSQGNIGGNTCNGPQKLFMFFGRQFSDTEISVVTKAIDDYYFKKYPQPVDYDVGLWINEVINSGSSVSDFRAYTLSELVYGLKGAGVWDLIDDFWVLVAENMTQALMSVKQRRMSVAYNNPSFMPDLGIAFNGTNQYIDTGFIPDTHKVAMTGTNMHIAVYERTNVNTLTMAAGCQNASTQCLLMTPRSSTDKMFVQLNSQSSGPAGDAVTDSRGFSLGTRNGTLAADVKAYKNGVAILPNQPGTLASVLPSLKVFIGARSGASNVPASFRAATEGFVSVGAAIPNNRQRLFYHAVRQYMIATKAYMQE